MSAPEPEQQVPGPLDRLSKRNATRRWIEAMIASGGPTDAEVERLCERARNPNGFRWKERAAVCWYLRNVTGPDAHRSFVAMALCSVAGRAEIDQRGRLIRWALRSIAAGYLVGLCVELDAMQSGDWATGLARLIAFTAPAVALALAGPMLLAQDILEAPLEVPSRVEAIRSLECIGAAESLASIARACGDRIEAVQESAMNAFPAIVARLTPEDYGSCGPAVPHLCKLLRDRRFDVQGAALTALELVGDGRAVTHVEGLSQWLKEPDARQRLGTERVQAMEAAIERALPILKDRQTRERDVSRLLRPAYKPGEDAETLLRPAEPGIGDDARLLVRPADGEGDP